MDFSYNISASYQDNFDRGPQLGAVPELPSTDSFEFLGQQVSSPLGIAAGLLPNAKWISGYAARGWDLLTYKTVRSIKRECYPVPNWVFVDADTGNGPVYATQDFPEDPSQISSAVCFGMPSMDPSFWREDISRAKNSLIEGQRLIVSVVASPETDWSAAQVAEDYAKCAAWAAEAGADVVEANYSCPNVCSAEGQVYMDMELTDTVTKAVRSAIGQTRLLLKVGVFPDADLQSSFLRVVAGVADGITLVNGISREVLHRDGRPVFGEDYVRAGVLGRIIHEPCVVAVREAKAAINAEGLNLALAAVGGVSSVSDYQDFIDAGADAVLCGSSPMYLPDLAAKIKASL